MKKHSWKKVALISILSIGAAIVCLLVFIKLIALILTLYSKDISPIDDSDLRLKEVVISEDDNAYFDLIKLKEIIYDPRRDDEDAGKATDDSDPFWDLFTGKVWDDKLAEKVISRNAQALEYFSNAARRPKFQDPAYAGASKDPYNERVHSELSWNDMSNISIVRALSLARQGRGKEALEEALISVRIGQKIQDSQADYIEYTVATSMKKRGLEAAQKIVSSSKFKTVELIPYIQELNQYYKNEDGLVNVIKVKYFFVSWAADHIYDEHVFGHDIAEKAKNTYYFKPNKTKAIFAERARAEIANTQKSCREVFLESTPLKWQLLALKSKIKLFLTENAAGKLLNDIMEIGDQSLHVTLDKCGDSLVVGGTQLLFALKAYKSDTGHLPDLLEQLAPKYIQATPIDPFDGKPLKYSLAKKIIYSAGKDLAGSNEGADSDCVKTSNTIFEIGF